MESIHYIVVAGEFNVRCLNGSAHARRTRHIEHVTCELCLNPEHNKEHWSRFIEEKRTKHQYSPITGEKFERFK